MILPKENISQIYLLVVKKKLIKFIKLKNASYTMITLIFH